MSESACCPVDRLYRNPQVLGCARVKHPFDAPVLVAVGKGVPDLETVSVCNVNPAEDFLSCLSVISGHVVALFIGHKFLCPPTLSLGFNAFMRQRRLHIAFVKLHQFILGPTETLATFMDCREAFHRE
jgi:hypothetical protein